MKVVFFNEEFEKPMLEKFFEAVNSPDEIIDVYLDSAGGHVAIMEVIIDVINNDPKRFRLTGYNELCSSAFELYIRVSCNKKLLPATLGMYHQTVSDISMNDNMKAAYYSGNAYIKKKKKYFWPKLLDFMNLCEFTDKEIKKIKKGQDVYFQYDRFKEIENAYIKNTRL